MMNFLNNTMTIRRVIITEGGFCPIEKSIDLLIEYQIYGLSIMDCLHW